MKCPRCDMEFEDAVDQVDKCDFCWVNYLAIITPGCTVKQKPTENYPAGRRGKGDSGAPRQFP